MTSAALKVSVKQSGNTRANTRANTSKATVLPQGLSIDLDVDERPVIQLQVPEPTKRGKKKVSKATGHVVTPEAPGLITDPLNQGWSAATHMTFPEPGLRYISLTKQPQTLRRVINDTIDIAIGIALFQDAFPKTEAQRHYIQLAMSGACDKLGQSVILDRFTWDTRYRDFIISCVTSRISHLRSEVKKEAAKVVPGLYDLLKLKPDARSELVKDLLKACCYIFPLGDPLKTYMASEADNAKEIPLAMLGLVGTAIFASLKEYSSGEHQKEGFEAAVFQEEYNKHIVFCQERIIKPDQSGRQKYHNLTAKLYREASNTTSFDDSDLPDIDFDGME
ncbi:hypothetical protein VKT23_018467 [Stygiomarasmius scandens]|uniref:DUF6532 domain-containing protein n=1 Tax=Marasmiellus scandens TaxID=2682957 RepID=A0ABR1IRW4_9AGAR